MYDVIVVGSGLAGVSTVLSLNEDLKVALMSKKGLYKCNSFLAQGGICMQKSKKDRKAFIKDTLKAGHYKNDKKAVEVLVDESQSAIKSLILWGVKFDKNGKEFDLTKEGGHSTNRILHCGDKSGRVIMQKVIKKLKKRKNVDLFLDTKVSDLLIKNKKCVGVAVGKKEYRSTYTVLATGGIGGLYKNSTNFKHICGDGIKMALNHDVNIKDISYIQTHPTALYESKNKRRFLLSESLRGEGAVIVNHQKKEFVNSLLPRDVVSEAIKKQMKKDGVDYEYLSFKKLKVDMKKRFCMIYDTLLKKGVDPLKEDVKIVPCVHYTMGGIECDLNAKTSLKRLFAVGEVANSGVHGSNRLASNSLLESVVFAKRAAKQINKHKLKKEKIDILHVDKIKSSKKTVLQKVKEDAKIKQLTH